HAAEVPPLPGLEQALVRLRRLLQLPAAVQEDGLAEAQLRVEGELRQALGAGLPGRVGLAERLVAADEVGVRLAEVGVPVAGASQAAAQVTDRLLVAACVGAGHAQVEEREGVL